MFEFDYALTGPGWAEARIADERGHAIVTASYLSDALRSLIEATMLAVSGVPDVRCSWDEKPGALHVHPDGGLCLWAPFDPPEPRWWHGDGLLPLIELTPRQLPGIAQRVRQIERFKNLHGLLARLHVLSPARLSRSSATGS